MRLSCPGLMAKLHLCVLQGSSHVSFCRYVFAAVFVRLSELLSNCPRVCLKEPAVSIFISCFCPRFPVPDIPVTRVISVFCISCSELLIILYSVHAHSGTKTCCWTQSVRCCNTNCSVRFSLNVISCTVRS